MRYGAATDRPWTRCRGAASQIVLGGERSQAIEQRAVGDERRERRADINLRSLVLGTPFYFLHGLLLGPIHELECRQYRQDVPAVIVSIVI